jgi:prepilin-type N-terminal cleavage/methylation domain-containing protein
MAKRRGFSLLELLVVIAVVAVLASLLLPALSQARQRVTVVTCMGNLKELSSAAGLYGGDFHEALPPNGTGDPQIKLQSVPVTFVPSFWVEGHEGGEILDMTADTMINERVSLLAPYLKAKGVFRCPGDSFSIRLGGRTLSNPRNYALNSSVGWVGKPFNGQGDASTFSVFYASTDIPDPSGIFTFGEIHPLSICQPFFGVHLMASLGAYHVPGGYHGRFTDFAFSDGHVEGHRWVNPSFNHPSFTGNFHNYHVEGVPGTDSRPDLQWLSQHASVKK